MILNSSQEYLDIKMSVLVLLCNFDRSQLKEHVDILMDISKGLESEQLKDIMRAEGFTEDDFYSIPCVFL